MDDLLQEFIAETREMMTAISGEIVAWEADPTDRSRLDGIFRFVHTVKGSCGFLDLPRLARLSHAAEDVLGDLRAGRRLADTGLVSAVLGVIDRIGELTEAIETGAGLPDEDDQRLIAALSVPADARDEPSAEPIADGFPRAPAAQRDAMRGVARTVRLPVDLLDRMMAGVSDMVLARNELARKLRETAVDTGLDASFERLSACVAEMRDSITRTRMQRIDNVFAALPRMVRDLSADLGRQVVLEVDGGDVELDREMIEMIRDPLSHIIRNAIDHGIERPEERRIGGKPAAGRLVVSARQAGNQIIIEVADDGRGIDGERIAAKAVSAGIVPPDHAAGMSWSQKVALVFEPGLSTAASVTTISGRGVGMDVVRANVERIGGIVDLESRPGTGLRVLMRVPLTLTIIPALTVQTGSCRFAIPRAAIDEIIRIASNRVTISAIGGGQVATIRGRRLPVVRLGALLGLPCDDGEPAILVVLRPAGGAVFALALDTVHDHEELVVKPAAPAIMAIGLYAGTTLPDSGRPMLLLDPAGIAAAAGVVAAEMETDVTDAVVAETVPTLLFHDLDGIERAIRLAVVERIDDLPAGAVREMAGHMRVMQDGRVVPLLSCRPALEPIRTTALRLSDGRTTLVYAIDRVIDIMPLAVTVAPAGVAGRIAGVIAVEDRQVELLDPFGLFAEAARLSPPPVRPGRPVALLGDGNDAWARDVLRPLVEAAGYRVNLCANDEDADLVIVTGGAALPMAGPPVLRLRTEPDATDGGGSIYRYDRDALMSALRSHAGGRG